MKDAAAPTISFTLKPGLQGAGGRGQTQTPPASITIIWGLDSAPCCKDGEVGGGCASASEASLNVFSSPLAAEISVSPAAEVQEGTATTFSCDVPGREDQKLNYTWYKNSVWFKEGTAHTLLFQHVATTDAGYYSCKVANNLGSDTSPAISLSVTCECQEMGRRVPTRSLCQRLHNPPESKQILCPPKP